MTARRYGRVLTLEEAREIAAQLERQQEQWQEQADPNSWDNRVASYYRHLDASAVVRLWEAGLNESGKSLTRFELAALIERWCELFGCLPPSDAAGQSAPATQPSEAEPQLDDLDTMTRADVARKLRASISTVQRMEKDGRLPTPLRTGPRARRHLVRDVNALIESLEQERDVPTRADRKHRGRGLLN
jgi:predicted DNA-binding transcriptional regulator AlpA